MIELIDWQCEAIKNSELDHEIQAIIGCHPVNGNIEGRKFTINDNRSMAFADVQIKTVYIPSWAKSKFNSDELEFIVFHEVGHIINNHTFTNLHFEYIADGYASSRQGRIGYAVNALWKLNRPHMIGDKVSNDFNPNQVKARIEKLKCLGLPW